MAYNSNNRSERLLQSRRFTTDNLTLSQEAFTDVLDLGADEIFTDDGLIPSGSSQLAYSGSSQDGGIISGSVVNPSISTDVQVLKFHYRHKLKQAADGQREVYYFTTSEPAAVTDTVTSDQLIETDQQTNFISPKYIIAAHSTRNAEALSPGYKAVVYKSTATSANSITEAAVTDDKYVFDYKTGVLTWVGSNQPSSNQFVYMTVYQYVGRTLRSQIDDGSIGASGVTSYTELTDIPDGLVSSSVQTIAHLVGQDVVVRNLTAENYVVSSSVTHMTTSFSSGSTIFGDDISDTHQMTGSLFVSGSISFSEIDGGNF